MRGKRIPGKMEKNYFSVAQEKFVFITCNNGVSVSKEYNLRRHYETAHEKKFAHECKLREDKFNVLKSDLQNVFTLATKTSEAAVYANFALTQIIPNDRNHLRMVCL
jgi:hypothetical protein